MRRINCAVESKQLVVFWRPESKAGFLIAAAKSSCTFFQGAVGLVWFKVLSFDLNSASLA